MNETDYQRIDTEVELEAGAVSEEDLTNITPASFRQLMVVPTDFTLSVLVDLLARGKIDLFPNYQRRVAWTDAKMSRFIESLFLRLPVPQIVLAETKPGKFAVVDGKQRISSTAEFCVDRNLRLQNC